MPMNSKPSHHEEGHGLGLGDQTHGSSNRTDSKKIRKIVLGGVAFIVVLVVIVVSVLLGVPDKDNESNDEPTPEAPPSETPDSDYQSLIAHLNLSPESSDELIEEAMFLMNSKFSKICNAGSVMAVSRAGKRTIVSQGVMKIGEDTPVDEDTIFEIGSISKTFVGLELARQVASGMLTLDTPLNDLLPESIPELMVNGTLVTVAELVTHTAGFPPLSNSLLKNLNVDMTTINPYAGFTEDDLVNDIAIAAEEGLSNSGEIEYSNFGFAVLAYILGKNANSTFPELQESLTDQLGLNSTWIGNIPDKEQSRLSTGSMAGADRAPYWYDGGVFIDGAGSTISSIKDLLLLSETLMSTRTATINANDDVLEALQLVLTPVRDSTNDIPGVAFSWFYFYTNPSNTNSRVYDHSGGTAGFASYAIFQPGSQTSFVALSNCGVDVDLVYMGSVLTSALFTTN